MNYSINVGFERFVKSLYNLMGVILFGVIGYVLVEGWTVGESFYMTIITMSTVGYGETRELTEIGRIFSCILIVFSILTIAHTTAYFTSSIVSGDISGRTWRIKMRKKAAGFSQHTIICGTGTITHSILERLTKSRQATVVVGNNEEEIAALKSHFPSVPIIDANPRSELALAHANLLKAETVIATLPDAFDNLLIAMTVRDLSSAIKIIARSDDPALIGRLKKSGINEVICPFLLTGEYAANLVSPATA